MRTLLLIITALTLTGCATCREHPVYCGMAVVVGGVVAAQALEKHETTVIVVPRRPIRH